MEAKDCVTPVMSYSPNTVAAVGPFGNGGAQHRYIVHHPSGKRVLDLQLQEGPFCNKSSVPGVTTDDLLAIVHNSLIQFQAGPLSDPDTEEAIQALAKVRRHVQQRTANRASSGVLGTTQPLTEVK